MYSIKQLTKLSRKGYRDQEGVFLAEGKKIIEEAVRAKAQIVQILVSPEFARAEKQFIQQLKSPAPLVEISHSNMHRLSGTKNPPGILAVIKKPTVTLDDLLKHQHVAIFEDVKDPGNLGTMLRTADWFGITGIIVTSTNVDPYNDKVLRSTMGSHFHQQLYTSANLKNDLQLLKDKGFSLIVSTLKGSTHPPTPNTKWALVMGNESRGVTPSTEQLADIRYTIPGRGQAESLNVGVSFGILLDRLVQREAA